MKTTTTITAVRGAFVFSVGSIVAAGCGAGGVASALRPSDPTAAGALGEAQCHKVEKYGEPLIVDWKPDQRGDLEEVMHDGVAVVSYSCDGIKLLKQCHLEGQYGFLGMTKREQVVRLNNADEVRANLPLSGLKIAGDIGGEMQRGATLDIALITIGKRRTTWKGPTKADLKGDCDGATHFVRGATVGAFALQTGTRADVKSTVQIFGAGASGSSSSSKDVNDKEGDPGECAKSSPDSKTPPGQCGAAVRLELMAIDAGTPASTTKPEAPPKEERPTLAVAEEPCPEGLVSIDGKCTKPVDDKPHQCEPGDEADCKKQCDKGSGVSCGALGAIYHQKHDWANALAAVKKGCDAGDTRSCVNEGELVRDGLGTKPDVGAAAQLFQTGCNQGDAFGCAFAGTAFRTGAGVSEDDAKAAGFFRKACDGGQAPSCGDLGMMVRDGAGGLTKDDKTANDLLRRGCEGNDSKSCVVLGEAVEGRDDISAGIFFERGCWGSDWKQSGRACADLGRVLQSGFAKNESRAQWAYEMACNKMNQLGCAALKLAFGGSRPVFPDVSLENQLQGVCSGGNARACATLGVLHVASGNPMGKGELDRACMMNDRWACDMKAKAH